MQLLSLQANAVEIYFLEKRMTITKNECCRLSMFKYTLVYLFMRPKFQRQIEFVIISCIVQEKRSFFD